MGMQDEISLLQATSAQVNMLDSGCCGMAGPFGFEKDKFEVSQALGERVLLPAVRSAARKRFWSPTGSVAGSRSGRIRLATLFIWRRFWPGDANSIPRHNELKR